jgi:hypothetical protein
MEIVNYQMLKHPMNWVIVFLMVFIGGIAVHLFLSWNGGKNLLAAS